MRTCLLLTLLLALLTACANLAPQQRRQHADALAAAHGWQKLRLPAGPFILTGYAPADAAPAATLTVYIEGDGLAWLTRAQASDDPTPRRPLGLELALRHPLGAAAYLARPCQYVAEADWPGCEAAYWTSRRFAPEVVEASSRAIDLLKQQAGAQRLVLVGYSGGGAVAALVAARRSDVVQLVTVAGNLDHRAWTALHHVPPLAGSLNPAEEWEALQAVPQLHFVGGKDKNMRAEIVRAYADRFPPARRPAMRVMQGFDHVCCWVEQWPELGMQILR